MAEESIFPVEDSTHVGHARGTSPVVHPLTRGKQLATVSLRLLIGFRSFRRP